MGEKSQEQIIFENLHTSHYSGWWGNYPSKSLGNIIHWIYVYGTLAMAENVIVGDNEIHLRGNLLMKYKYVNDIPYFYDLQDEKYQFIIDNQEIYLNGLKNCPEFVEEIDKKYSALKKIFKSKIL